MGSDRPKLALLTTLRGVAAVYVVAVHTSYLASSDAYAWLQNGRGAVTIFFVLSGFIMQYTYRGCSFTTPDCKRAFFIRRAARILPLYMLSLITTYPYLKRALESQHTGVNTVLIITTLTLTQGFFVYPYTAWNGVAWSLSVEAFFYALFPYLHRIIETRVREVIGLIVFWFMFFCVVVPSVGAYNMDNLMFIFAQFPPFRIPDFLCGMMCHELWERAPRSWLNPYVFGPIGLAALWIHLEPPFPFAVVVLFKYSTGMILSSVVVFSCLVVEDTFIGAILASETMAYAGEVSYAMYLFHTSLDWVPGTPWHYALLGVIGVASLMHFCVENPVYRWVVKRVDAKCTCNGQ